MPRSRREWPAVSDYVVEPETNFELFEGEVRECLPANSGHSAQHSLVTKVLEAHKAPGYLVDVDLLTRQSKRNNFASDNCVRKAGVDPATGERHLEELAIEIKATQRPGDLKKRARRMVKRGIRRVFAIPVKGTEGSFVVGPVLEWDQTNADWIELDPKGTIEDSCLRRKLPVKALLDAVEADRAVAEALVASRHPTIVKHAQSATRRGFRKGEKSGYQKGEKDGYQKGKDEGRLESTRNLLLMLLEQRRLAVDADTRARIDACTEAEVLERWFRRAGRARRLRDVFDDA